MMRGLEQSVGSVGLLQGSPGRARIRSLLSSGWTLAALLGLAVILYAGRYWLYWDRFVEGMLDDAIWIPLAWRWDDETLFPRDPFVTDLVSHFPRAYLMLAGVLLRVWTDPGTFLLALSTLLLLLYAGGVYYLALQVLGHRPSAWLIAVVALRPNVDLTGTGWGIFLGSAPPRSCVFAAVPWLLAWFIRRMEGGGGLAAVGLVLGLLGNLHPLTVLHVFLLLSGAVCLGGPGRTKGRRVAELTAGLMLGMIPYLTQWMLYGDWTALRLELVHLRAEPQSFPTWQTLGWDLVVVFLPVTLVGALGWWAARPDANAQTGWLLHFALIVAVCAPLGPLLTVLQPRLFAVHLLRMSGYWFLLAAVLSGFLVRRVWESPSRLGPAAGCLIATVLFVTAGGGRVGELAGSITAEGEPVRVSTLGVDTGPKSYGVPDKGAFLDFAAWAQRETPSAALFVTPVSGFESFRLYGRRSVLVTFKDGAVMVFSGQLAEQWYERYREIDALYAGFNAEGVRAVAQRYGADYVVQDAAHPPVRLPVVYENARVRVYGVASNQ